ncbi:CPBP family intramembrane metalloprotease [Angustibacter peucedani]
MTTRWSAALRRAMGPALLDPVPRDHSQPDAAFRRRRVVVAVVLVVGATLLGISLAVRPGDPVFYPLTVLLAAVWVVGSFASGPLHLGRIAGRGRLRRPVVTPLLLGLAAGAVFVVGALVVRQVPALAGRVDDVLAHADEGSYALVAVVAALNGVAEELFFRGALFAAVGRRHAVLVSTLVYTLATVATLNAMLVLAALLLGLLLGLMRRATGGVLGPAITHVTWSMCMLLVLPALFGR